MSVGEKNKTKILKVFDTLIVSEGSARYGEYCYTLDADHFTICKPTKESSPSFKILLGFIQDIKDQEKSMDIEFISSKKFFVGLESRVEDVKEILQKVSTLGLYGMGGVGKTTLAHAVYMNNYQEFDYSCWVSDFRELAQKQSGQHLRHCMLENLRSHGKKMSSKDRDWDDLKGEKVLFVVDNIDADHLLEEIPLTGWFGNESKVIITSRDKRFCQERFEMAMEVKFLTESQSVKLFSHHAFERDHPPAHLVNHVNEVLRFCDGVPLAIETIARTLRNEKDEEEWESVIQKLKDGEPPDGKKDNRLLNTLQLSYDRFQPKEQKLFLDSALLFKGMPISEVLLMWKASWGSGVKRSWKNLIANCLVDLRGQEVWVHETLCMLARNIACPKHDKKGMRTWLVVITVPEVTKLLRDNSQEPCEAEGLIYEPRHSNRAPLVLYRESISEARFSRLRVLTMTNVHVDGDAIRLPPWLVYLKWSHASQTTFPFVLRHLTDLCWLELKGCHGLISIPEDVDALARLNRLELEGCSSLMLLPTGIEMLTALVYLGAASSGLRELPESLGNLANLEILVLRGSRVSKLPDSVGKLDKLKVIDAEEIPLTELPLTLVNCLSITRLDLRHTSLTRLPESFGSMRNLLDLDLSHTRLEMLPCSFTELNELENLELESTLIRHLPEHIGDLRSLWDLRLGDTPLEELPGSITRLGKLSVLFMDGCKKLGCLPEHFGDLRSLSALVLRDTPLEELPGSITRLENLSELDMNGCKKLACLPNGFENMKGVSCFDFISGNQRAIPINLSGWNVIEQLEVDYHASLFDAHGSATDGIAQRETMQWTTSASTSVHNDCCKGEAGQLLLRETGLGLPRGSYGSGEIVQGIRNPFEHLHVLTVIGNANLAEFPRPLLHALPHMRLLVCLKLSEFHAISRLPEKFGDFLPYSLESLRLHGWRSLEKLPESLGSVPKLDWLDLLRLISLKGLPETLPDWPHLLHIRVEGCESLHGWSSRGFGRSVHYISTDSWTLMRELVENHGHLARLQVDFEVKREDAEGVAAALRAWESRHPSLSLPYDFSSSSFDFEAVGREQVQGVADTLRYFYGGGIFATPVLFESLGVFSHRL